MTYLPFRVMNTKDGVLTVMKVRALEKKNIQKRTRAAAYCRVSTEHDEQEDSLENQIRHYEDGIKANPTYELVEVYYDFGISGFKEKRPGFQRMMEDARKGKMDLIITKSISRFARNTSTVLDATRELKALGVGVFFELQGINTLSSEGELMMTIYAAFAQAESESIREGAKMVYRHKYEAGIPVQYLERSFGYRKDSEGNYEIEETEAGWIRKIYYMIADGYTPAAVKRFLNDNGILSVNGVRWNDNMVIRLVENEIYKGDYIMHKHFVNEERKLVRNMGQADSWYVEHDHVPIVSKRLWQKAQDALAERRKYLAGGKKRSDFPYENNLFCAHCGHRLRLRKYGNNRMSWGCSGMKDYSINFCKGVNVPDSVVREWNPEKPIYIYEKSREKGIPEHGFYSESYWKRDHRKKEYTPEIPEIEYYHRWLRCAICGGKLTRHINRSSGKEWWICSTSKHNGISVCPGVRVPDSVVRKWLPITEPIYIRRNGDGEEGYSYSCKAEGGNP